MSHRGRRFWGVVDYATRTIQELAEPFEGWAADFCNSQRLPALVDRSIPLGEVAFLPPLVDDRGVLFIGTNYRSPIHGGSSTTAPPRPRVFLKPREAFSSPIDELEYPAVTSQLDYEVELAVFLGRPLGENDANPLASVFGYSIGNDVAMRDLLFASPGDRSSGIDLFAGKVYPGTTGLGPCITTIDEFDDGPPDLEIRLSVNGDVRQHDRTSQMIWDVPTLLRYLNEFKPLRFADVVFTGTPAGIGFEDGQYLVPGDVIEMNIEGLGTLTQTVGSRPASRLSFASPPPVLSS